LADERKQFPFLSFFIGARSVRHQAIERIRQAHLDIPIIEGLERGVVK